MRNKIKNKRKALIITFSFLSLLVVTSLFLFSFTTANTLSSSYDTIRYDEKDLKVIFEDKGIEKGDMILRSHNSIDEIIKVAPGWDLTLWYDTNFKDLQENVIQEPVFIDQRTGEIVDREYKFVYYVMEERERDVCTSYEQIEVNNTNSTNETSYINDNCLTYGKEKYNFQGWEEWNSTDIPKGSFRLGLMVNNLPDDYIDGIFKIGGKSLTKHASWEASLETDLEYWYKLDETTGDVIDWTGTNDGTNNGTTRGATGIIGNAFDFDASNSENIDLGSSHSHSTGDDYSVNAWAYFGSETQSLWGVGGSSGSEHSLWWRDGDNQLIFGSGADDDSTVNCNTDSGGDLAGSWHMVTAVVEQSGSDFIQELYLDGTRIAGPTTTSSKTIDDFGGNNMYLGRYPNDISPHYMNGKIDEVGIWSRALTSTEVSDLYNSGDGLTPSDYTDAEVETIDASSIGTSQATLNGNLTLNEATWGEVFFQYRQT